MIRRYACHCDNKIMTTTGLLEDDAETRLAQYREAIDRIGDAFFILGPDMTFVEVNDALCALLGRTRESLIGASPMAFVSPQDAELMRQRLATMKAGERRVNQYNVLRSDGTLVPVLGRGVLFCWPDGRWRCMVGFATDLSAIESINQRLADSERELRSVLDNMVDVYYRTDAQGVILRGSRSVEQLLGWKLEDLLGRRMADLYVDPSERGHFLELLKTQGGEVRHFETRLRHREGHDVWVSTNARYYRAADGSVAGVEGTVREVTALRQAKERVEYMARHDPLTQLLNRWTLRERVEHAIAGRRSDDDSFALLFIDINDFKQINDRHGHWVGDGVLREIARRIASAVRGGDLVCRHGGDEFVAMLPGLQTSEQIAAVIAQIEQAVAQPIAIAPHALRVGCSIGLARFPTDGSDYDTLLRHADASMYRVKRRAA